MAAGRRLSVRRAIDEYMIVLLSGSVSVDLIDLIDLIARESDGSKSVSQSIGQMSAQQDTRTSTKEKGSYAFGKAGAKSDQRRPARIAAKFTLLEAEARHDPRGLRGDQ